MTRRCPDCNTKLDCLETRAIENGFVMRRRRECPKCYRRITTYERIALEESDIDPEVLIRNDRLDLLRHSCEWKRASNESYVAEAVKKEIVKNLDSLPLHNLMYVRSMTDCMNKT